MDVTFLPPQVVTAVAPAPASAGGTLKKALDFVKNNKWVWLVIAAVAYWLWTKFGAKKGGCGATTQVVTTPTVNVPPAPATDPNFTRLSTA